MQLSDVCVEERATPKNCRQLEHSCSAMLIAARADVNAPFRRARGCLLDACYCLLLLTLHISTLADPFEGVTKIRSHPCTPVLHGQTDHCLRLKRRTVRLLWHFWACVASSCSHIMGKNDFLTPKAVRLLWVLCQHATSREGVCF